MWVVLRNLDILVLQQRSHNYNGRQEASQIIILGC